MTVVRNWVEPNLWGRFLEARPLPAIYDHVPPAKWLIDMTYVVRERLEGKPAGWYGWDSWEPEPPVSVGSAIRRTLSGGIPRWLLARIGYRVYVIELGITNHLACRNCGEDECVCGIQHLYVVDTTYSINGVDVAPDAYQVEFDRFYRKWAAGQILERIP